MSNDITTYENVIDLIEEDFRHDLGVHLYSTVLMNQINPLFPRKKWQLWPLTADQVPIPRGSTSYSDLVDYRIPPAPNNQGFEEAREMVSSRTVGSQDSSDDETIKDYQLAAEKGARTRMGMAKLMENETGWAERQRSKKVGRLMELSDDDDDDDEAEDEDEEEEENDIADDIDEDIDEDSQLDASSVSSDSKESSHTDVASENSNHESHLKHESQSYLEEDDMSESEYDTAEVSDMDADEGIPSDLQNGRHQKSSSRSINSPMNSLLKHVKRGRKALQGLQSGYDARTPDHTDTSVQTGELDGSDQSLSDSDMETDHSVRNRYVPVKFVRHPTDPNVELLLEIKALFHRTIRQKLLTLKLSSNEGMMIESNNEVIDEMARQLCNKIDSYLQTIAMALYDIKRTGRNRERLLPDNPLTWQDMFIANLKNHHPVFKPIDSMIYYEKYEKLFTDSEYPYEYNGIEVDDQIKFKRRQYIEFLSEYRDPNIRPPLKDRILLRQQKVEEQRQRKRAIIYNLVEIAHRSRQLSWNTGISKSGKTVENKKHYQGLWRPETDLSEYAVKYKGMRLDKYDYLVDF